jgi:hypothetical protein
VIAIVGFFICPPLGAIVALVLANSTQKRIEASGGRLSGLEQARAARIIAIIELGRCRICREQTRAARLGNIRTRRVRPHPIPRSAFAGFWFPPDVIVLAVRWYLRFGLSYRDVEELLAERSIEVDHVTVYRWVVRFPPLLIEAARPCRHPVGIAAKQTRPM